MSASNIKSLHAHARAVLAAEQRLAVQQAARAGAVVVAIADGLSPHDIERAANLTASQVNAIVDEWLGG